MRATAVVLHGFPHMWYGTWKEEASGERGDTLASGQPEIILTDTPGELLQVDALAYPEDTYLVVDPYSPLRAVETPFSNLVAEAEAILPRPVGEIIPVCIPEVAAARVFQLVLLDLNEPRPCRSRVVEKTLRRLIREAADLGVRHLGLDRFELLEPCISAYRLISCLLGETARLASSGVLPPDALTFALHHPAALRHYEVAVAHLPGR
jgi:hypothetical protein